MFKVIGKLWHDGRILGYRLQQKDEKIDVLKDAVLQQLKLGNVDNSNVSLTISGLRVYGAEDIDLHLKNCTTNNFKHDIFATNTKYSYYVAELISHGGTTFSSGALQKWDFEGYMIKGTGEYVTQAINEAYISEVLYLTHILTAKYGLIQVLNRNDSGILRNEAACITELFTGNKIDVRVLLRKDNSWNDKLIKLADCIQSVQEKQRLYDMFILDYIFVQRDRHMKNIEYLSSSGQYRLSPLFDFGGCLWYEIPDAQLRGLIFDDSDKTKIESRTNFENVKFIRQLVDKVGFNLTALVTNSKVVMNKYAKYYGQVRSKFILDLIERRVQVVREIFSY